jgi:uncharacterized lipoprotein YmbA
MRQHLWAQRLSGLLALSIWALMLGGCGSAPPALWLSLPLPLPATGASAPSSPASGLATQTLIVRRVSIPEYLQADKVRFRLSDSVLGEWPRAVWAERLEVGLTDHLAMRLRLALPGWTVCERSCPATASSLVLNVDLAPLDYVRAHGELRAEARWQLAGNSSREHQDKTPGAPRLGAMAFVTPVQPDSAEGQAAALGRLLDQLAHDIVEVVHTGP